MRKILIAVILLAVSAAPGFVAQARAEDPDAKAINKCVAGSQKLVTEMGAKPSDVLALCTCYYNNMGKDDVRPILEWANDTSNPEDEQDAVIACFFCQDDNAKSTPEGKKMCAQVQRGEPPANLHKLLNAN
jgi:hypothetical protein